MDAELKQAIRPGNIAGTSEQSESPIATNMVEQMELLKSLESIIDQLYQSVQPVLEETPPTNDTGESVGKLRGSSQLASMIRSNNDSLQGSLNRLRFLRNRVEL